MGIVKNTFVFYLVVYAAVSVFSLLVCLEDIDHFQIVCPRLGHHIKQDLLELFRPIRTHVIDDLLAQLIQVNEKWLSILIFSGLLVICLQFIYLLQSISYVVLTRSPQPVQYLLHRGLKVLACCVLFVWVLVYISGIGLNKFLEISGKLYDNPESYPIYVERMNAYYEDKRQEFYEYLDY